VAFSHLSVIFNVTHKSIELGADVWKKMQRRGLSRRDIREALALGVWEKVETFHGEQRLAKVAPLRGRLYRLVFIERQHDITIVSFHPID
jgi:hypothetical protein